MNAKIIGSIAGALIVSLALTAGRQYAEAAQANKAYEVCFEDRMADSNYARTAVNSYMQLREITIKHEDTIREMQQHIDLLQAALRQR